MLDTLTYLLLQARDSGDPMQEHEVDCFARVLQCSPRQVRVFDLLNGSPTSTDLDSGDIVLLGGSGDYSIAQGGPWLEPTLETMRQLHAVAKPTFASCWGFQAMARALGGVVITDPSRAEVGTHEVSLTPAGEDDPVFSVLPRTFSAQMGHEDVVDRLPDDAVLLASTNRVKNQAFRFAGKPIYCTQFHPELNLEALLDRLRIYPKYVQRILGMPIDALIKTCVESPASEALLPRFIRQVAGD